MSEDFSIQDESSIHKYRTEIPNIIFELGLTPDELAIYLIFKRAAGDNGKCIKSTRRIAKEAKVSRNNLLKIKNKLSNKFSLINKSLIECYDRFSDCGDKDTCEVHIVDIWPENFLFFNKKIGGSNEIPRGSNKIPPGSNQIPQVAQTRYQGGSNECHKEEPFKKNPFKKTATTPTPSKGNAVVDAVFSEEKKKETIESQLIAEKEAAKSLKEWMDKEANKIRQRKEAYSWIEDKFGPDWIIPLESYENLIRKYGISYFDDQLKHMLDVQKRYFSGKAKNPINAPEIYLRKCCKENFAESTKKRRNLNEF